MNDLEIEREIRATFRRRGVDVLDPEAVPPVRTVVRKTRRHQATTIATVGVVVIATVVASIAGVGALIRSSERRVPLKPPFSPGALQAVAAQPISFEGLVADANGRLWSRWPGLTVFDPPSGSFRTFTLAADPAFGSVVDITPARAGGVWMLSPWRGEQRVRRVDVDGILEVTAPIPDHVGLIAEGPDGTLWASGKDIWSWDGTSWVGVAPPGGWPHGAEAIAVDTAGNLWAGMSTSSYPGGVFRYDGTGWTAYTIEEVLPIDDVVAIDPDRRISRIVPGSAGDVWVGGRGGMAHFADGTWTSYRSTGLGLRFVESIAVTDSGVWVGGLDPWGGPAIARFDGTTWTRVVEGLEGSWTKVAATPQGVWAATDTDLFRLDGSRWVRATSERRPPDEVFPLEAAGADELWTGGWAGSYLWHLQGDVWTRFGYDEVLPGGARVNALQVAPDGAVWAAMDAGLARFDGVAWEQVETGAHTALELAPDGRVWTAGPDGTSDHLSVHPIGGPALPPLHHMDASSIAVGPAGDVWVGSAWFSSNSGGLAHFDGVRWRRVHPFGEGRGFTVLGLEIAPDGGVWVALSHQGEALIHYQDGVWTTVVEADGVPIQGSIQLDKASNGEILLSLGVQDGPPGGGGLFAFRDGDWHLVQEGQFAGLSLSVAPDGTVWLWGDGLFRLAGR